VSAIAPDRSLLKYVINQLISALYPSDTTPPTVDLILAGCQLPAASCSPQLNDAVVTFQSQIAGTQPGKRVYFDGLSHSGIFNGASDIQDLLDFLPNYFPVWDDSNVLADPQGRVNKLVECWLKNADKATSGIECLPTN
jgi:hypothetical protein